MTATKGKIANLKRVGYFARSPLWKNKPYKHRVPTCPEIGLDEVAGLECLNDKRTLRQLLVQLLDFLYISKVSGSPPGALRNAVEYAEANSLIRPLHCKMDDFTIGYTVEVCYEITTKGKAWLAENKEAVRAYFAPRIEQLEKELAKIQAACA